MEINKTITAILVGLLSMHSFADVPNTFQAGEAIKASDMNENFTAIDSEIKALDTRTENISDLETKVANLEGQLETLQSLVNSVAETASDEVKFVGYSSPEVFGEIGLQAGRSACPNAYPGSQICSVETLRNTDDWTLFTTDKTLFLVLTSDGTGSYANLCGDYSSQRDGVSYGQIVDGKLYLRNNSSSNMTFSSNDPHDTDVIGFIQNAFSANTYRVDIYSNKIDYNFYFCSVPLSAACCM